MSNRKPNPVITLTTDFGLKDPYVGEIKGVILSLSPQATITDVSHQVEKFNIRMGAYILASACQYFPNGTIHVAIVDPGVGTRRHSLIVQTRRGYFVGPDNGILTLAARNSVIEHAYKITNRKLMLPRVSNTFHGRDTFAPTAAHLANGTPPSEFGPETLKIKTPRFAKITRKKHVLEGEIIHVDDFGNIVTNLTEKDLEFAGAKDAVHIKLGSKETKLKVCRTYADVRKGKPLAIIGSHNFLEISINQGDAAETLKVKSGDKAILYRD